MSVFDEYAQEYDSWYDKNRFSFLSEIEAIKKVLPPGRGVEIGTGSGRFAKELGIKWGVEPSKAMAQMCLRRGVKVEIAQAESLPFASGSFDFALFVTSFCFLKEPLAALREAHRILSPGGCVILGIIDRESFLGKAYGKKKSKFYEEAHFYSAAEAIEILKRAEFRFEKAYQTLFINPSQLRKIDEIREGFGEGSFVVMRACK